MLSAWLDITARRYDEKEIFGIQSVRMSETRINPAVSNFIQTPSVNNCILAGMRRGTIGETEVEPCGCIRRPTARQCYSVAPLAGC
jgi:hypothetical protein